MSDSVRPEVGEEAVDNGQVMERTYRYRIYPTRRQVEALENQLAFACDLYNAALEQRRDWWKRGRRITRFDQSIQFTEFRPADLDMSSWTQREVFERLDLAFQAFFRRCKAGEKPGYPRFRSRARYDALKWSPKHGGCGLANGRLRLQGVGHVKVRWHREIPADAEVRQVTVLRKAGGWYACFALRLPLPEPLPATGEEVGVDLGILTFAALSNGEAIEGPRAYRGALRRLRIAQRRVARRKKGSKRRAKAVALLAKQHDRIREIRRDHRHKTVRALVDRFDTIYVENLNVRGLARGRLAKDTTDQGWGQFLAALDAKAEEAGRQVVAVDPRNTSQVCSSCGAVVAKPLSEREHRCDCGYVADRDVNAARNILRLGRSLQARTVGEEVHAVA